MVKTNVGQIDLLPGRAAGNKVDDEISLRERVRQPQRALQMTDTQQVLDMDHDTMGRTGGHAGFRR